MILKYHVNIDPEVSYYQRIINNEHPRESVINKISYGWMFIDNSSVITSKLSMKSYVILFSFIKAINLQWLVTYILYL